LESLHTLKVEIRRLFLPLEGAHTLFSGQRERERNREKRGRERESVRKRERDVEYGY